MPMPLAPVVAAPISRRSRETGRSVAERTTGSAGARSAMNSDAQAGGSGASMPLLSGDRPRACGASTRGLPYRAARRAARHAARA